MEAVRSVDKRSTVQQSATEPLKCDYKEEASSFEGYLASSTGFEHTDKPNLIQRSVAGVGIQKLSIASVSNNLLTKLCPEQAAKNIEAYCERLGILSSQSPCPAKTYDGIIEQLGVILEKRTENLPIGEAVKLCRTFTEVLYSNNMKEFYTAMPACKTAEEKNELLEKHDLPFFKNYLGFSLIHLFFIEFLSLNDCEQKLIVACLVLLAVHPAIPKLIADYAPGMSVEDYLGENSSTEMEKQKLDVALKLAAICTFFCTDVIFVIRNTKQPAVIISKLFLDDEGYIETLKSRYSLYQEIAYFEDSLHFFISLPCSVLWWQHANLVCAQKNHPVSRLSQAALADFLCETCIPQWLETILFDDNNECRALFSSTPLSKTVLPEAPCQLFNKQDILFGEEFEYKIPLLEGTNIFNFRRITLEAMQQWKQTVQKTEPTVKFTEMLMAPYYANNGITASLRQWQVKLYPEVDIRDNCPIMEFNASPYGMNQQFQLDDHHTYNAYTLLRKFVIEPAKQYGWHECSGHKHIDLIRTIGNNTELLFRLLVDVENQGWFPVILQRERYSKEHFPYFCQADSDLSHKIFINSVNSFNRCLTQDKYKKKSNMCYQLACFDSWFKFIVPEKNCRKPCTVNYTLPSTSEAVINGKVSEATTTLEFRFFHCARNETEVKLINELLVAWLENLSQQQQKRKPLRYKPLNPIDIPFERAVYKFAQFIKKLGLEWKIYRQLVWYPPGYKPEQQPDATSN